MLNVTLFSGLIYFIRYANANAAKGGPAINAPRGINWASQSLFVVESSGMSETKTLTGLTMAEAINITSKNSNIEERKAGLAETEVEIEKSISKIDDETAKLKKELIKVRQGDITSAKEIIKLLNRQHSLAAEKSKLKKQETEVTTKKTKLAKEQFTLWQGG